MSGTVGGCLDKEVPGMRRHDFYAQAHCLGYVIVRLGSINELS